MRVCDLETPAASMTHAARRLREAWATTREHWRDANSQEFEALHLQPLQPHLTSALSAIQRFAELLRQAERDCGDDTPE